MIEQLGTIDELVVGGYHAMDCVKRIAEFALECGIDTLVDLDLTDIFFRIYKQKDYFNIENYNPERFKLNMVYSPVKEEAEFLEMDFNKDYSSPVYGFTNESSKRR